MGSATTPTAENINSALTLPWGKGKGESTSEGGGAFNRLREREILVPSTITLGREVWEEREVILLFPRKRNEKMGGVNAKKKKHRAYFLINDNATLFPPGGRKKLEGSCGWRRSGGAGRTLPSPELIRSLILIRKREKKNEQKRNFHSPAQRKDEKLEGKSVTTIVTWEHTSNSVFGSRRKKENKGGKKKKRGKKDQPFFVFDCRGKGKGPFIQTKEEKN